jgi:Flp pilus assembly protein TadB
VSAPADLLAATAAAASAYLLVRPATSLGSVADPTAADATAAASPDTRPVLTRLRPVLVLPVVGAGWVVLGGPPGLLLGAIAGAVAWVVLGRSEAPAARVRRERLAADLPAAVDLLATALAAGSSIEPALRAVCRALGGPVGEELGTVAHRLALGMEPRDVWRAVATHPQLGPFGRAALRAHESGASVATAVHRLADELRERARAEVEARAKTVEVRAAAPLGVCFLPAFVLLGVVPMVAGLFGSLHLFG